MKVSLHTPTCDLGEDDADEEITLVVTEAETGLRPDQLLACRFAESSRSLVASSIRAGTVLVDGDVRKASYRLKPGETIHGALLQPQPLDVVAEYVEFPILYEDEDLLVLSKPPGLVVHPGCGNPRGTLVNGLLYHCRTIAEVGDAARPGIVHRLDKDTSGLMVVAKRSPVHRLLVDMFKARQVEKEYLAIVHGVPSRREGRIVAAIGRHQINRQKMAVREISGRYAASSWQVLATSDSQWSKIKVAIETGRTHQIRVHMAHIGHPVAGDALYGGGRNNTLFPRQMLHAWRLRFTHPVQHVPMQFEAPVWEDMRLLCGQLFLTDDQS